MGLRQTIGKPGIVISNVRSKEIGALVGFEKSGHYFFNAPIGRGYDDGILSAIAILQMLDRNPDKSMADLRHDLPKNMGQPNHEPLLRRREKIRCRR